jgi:hypothetical protein
MTALIVDFVRRNKFGIFFLAMQILLLCRSAWGRSSWLDEIAVSLVVATFLAMIAHEWFAAREFRQLPVSRRTLWLAEWWLAAPLGSLLMVSVVHFAHWSKRPQEWSLDGTAMALIYCLAYTGATQAIFTTPLGRRADEPAIMGNVGGWMMAMFGMIAAPAAFGPYLPHRLAEAGPLTGMLLAVCLALAIRGYRHIPPIVATPHLRVARVPPPPAPQPYAAPQNISPEERAKRKERIRALPLWIRALMFVLGIRSDESERGVADKLEGFRLLVWLEGRRDFIACVVAVTFVAVVRMFGLFDEDGLPPWREFGGTLGFLPFLRAPGALADVMAIGAIGFFASMASHARVNNLRMLRALPLSAHRLIGRVAALSVVSALMVWFVLLLVHLVSTFSLPVSLRIDVLVAATALTLLVSAVRLATLGTPLPPPLPQSIAIAVPCALWYAAFTWPLRSPVFSMALASAVVLALAYVVLLIAIRRSSRIYRPAPSTIAIR